MIENDIAVISLSGRFPKCNSVESLWNMLLKNETSIETIDEEVLKQNGYYDYIAYPNYVNKYSEIEQPDLFDADFFNMNQAEAMLCDPQQRLFLHCCLEGLDLAGYPNPENQGMRTGVFTGCSISTYFIFNLLHSKQIMQREQTQLIMSAANDFLATRVAYKLNLKGPALTIQTACSTSLVAVHQACQSLLSGETDLALAGGVTVSAIRKQGYFYTPNGIRSPDGMCRPFDSMAAGTIFGDGVGVVVLCRLEDALKNNNFIYSVIKGSAVNNDGNDKTGYTAPSVSGQTEVIKEAMALAGVSPEQMTFVEAHGTATKLGDPIEFKALTLAYNTSKKQYCALGSIKSNVGHLDAASGVVGLIKAVLSLHNRILPASINYVSHNLSIDINNSPFFICSKNIKLDNLEELYAGVSSFGIGGTNAHVILANRPVKGNTNKSSAIKNENDMLPVVYLWSDRTNDNLTKHVKDSIDYFSKYEAMFSQRDFAYSLMRKHHHDYRAFCIAKNYSVPNVDDICKERCLKAIKVIFLISCEDVAWINVARDLYLKNEVFAEHVNYFSSKFNFYFNENIKDLIFPKYLENQQLAIEKEKQIKWMFPALFILISGIVKVYESFGIKSDLIVGYGLGELISTYIAKSISDDDIVKLIVTIGNIEETIKKNTLVVFGCSSLFEQLPSIIKNNIDMVVINEASQFVLSGTLENIVQAYDFYVENEVKCEILTGFKGFYTGLIDSYLDEYKEVFEKTKFDSIDVPILSNLSGEIFSKGHIFSADYWIENLRQTVLFSNGISQLDVYVKNNKAEPVFIEIFPGATLSNLIRMRNPNVKIISAFNESKVIDLDVIYYSLAKFWSLGGNFDLDKIIPKSNIVPVPVSYLDPKSYWIYPDEKQSKDKEANLLNNNFIDSIKNEDDIEDSISEKLLKIFRNALMDESFGVEDNFFEFGGDSITALGISRQSSECGIVISPNNIFEYQTINEIILFLKQKDVVEKEESFFVKNKEEEKEEEIDKEDLETILEQIEI